MYKYICVYIYIYMYTLCKGITITGRGTHGSALPLPRWDLAAGLDLEEAVTRGDCVWASDT